MRRSSAWICLLVLLFSAACVPTGPASGSLPFTTIEQKYDAAYAGQQQYTALGPGLLVFEDAAAAEEAGVWFSESARRMLEQVDWRTQLVIAVFQGWQSTGGYGVTIEAIVLEGGVLRVEAAFQQPGDAATGAVTSPYHLVAVRRPAGPVRVELYDGETRLAEFPAPAPAP